MTTASVIRSIIEFSIGILLIVGFIYERKFIAFEDKIASIIAIVRKELRAEKEGRISAERRAFEDRQRQEILNSRRTSGSRSGDHSSRSVYRSSVQSQSSRVA